MLSHEQPLMVERLPGHICLYSVDEIPLFFTTGEEDKIFPTLYLCHGAPQAAPSITIHPGY